MFFPSCSSWFVNDYCVLDLETTGLKAKACEIIEVGIVKVRNGQTVSKMSVLIRPKTLPIPPFITRLTGITTEMVASAPSIEEVSYWIYDFIGSDPILGYNVLFDLSFLRAHTTKHTPNNCFLDVLALARICFPELSSHSLSNMTAHLHLYQNTHRAIDDCIATYQLYEICKQMLVGKTNREIDNMIEEFRQQRRARRYYSKQSGRSR